MSGWTRTTKDGLTIHQAATISWLPNIVQGFTGRQGGVSEKPLDSLNMSVNVGDSLQNVTENRRRAIQTLVGDEWPIYSATQVHGDFDRVCRSESPKITEGADALITDQSEIMLLMLFADCVPIFYCDPVKRVVAMAHSGWRGTAANIGGKTVRKLIDEYGCDVDTLYAAIGPSISQDRYEVDLDVVDALRGAWNGMGTPFLPKNEFSGKFLVDLRMIIFGQLLRGGIRPRAFRCPTIARFETKEFFSHRRDAAKGGKTGRMAGLIGMRPMGAPVSFSFPSEQ